MDLPLTRSERAAGLAHGGTHRRWRVSCLAAGYRRSTARHDGAYSPPAPTRRWRRPEEAADCSRNSATVLTVPGDLTDPKKVSQLFDAATERFGGIDVVVANAGRSGATKPVADITDEEYDGLQAVNNRAVFLVLREAARRIRDGGRIINISSSTTAYPQTVGGKAD